MTRSLLLFLAPIVVALISAAVSSSIFHPISDAHRSAALELLHGPFSSLEETYEALRTFEVLGLDKKALSEGVCKSVLQTLDSSSSTPKDLFYALKVNGILKCKSSKKAIEGIITKLQAAAGSSSSLLDFHYSIGSLVLIKDQASKEDLYLDDAKKVFQSVKALSQSDGRWRYSSNNPESSTFASGLALQTLAGVISLSSSAIDESQIGTIKNNIVKLFDTIEKYDDGTFYFVEKSADASDYRGPLSTTWSVVKGFTEFAAVTPGRLKLPEDKILGLAKFFLGVGIAGDAKDFFNQVDSLACLENNRVSIPLILSLPATVLSFTKKDILKVNFKTVLGSNAPPSTVKLVRVINAASKDTLTSGSQELRFDAGSAVYVLDALPKGVDIGRYTFVFEVLLGGSEPGKVYTIESQTEVPIFVTGTIKVDNAEMAILDNDLGSVETQKKLNLAEDDLVSLSAYHLQKLRLSFQLTTPKGKAFVPHQAILKLTHESKVEHVFVVGNSGKQFEIVLNFLGLVEKFYYLSGRYDIQLTVGDTAMENSFLKDIGDIVLDLPEAPEKAPRPPSQPVDLYSRYGPKAEITHIFRAPEKLPQKELSLVFLGLTLLPFFGFLIGLLRLGVNLKNFPSSAVPATFAALFHLGIAAVLLLYVLFWLQLDLFTTLKALGFLGAFLMFVGHRTLSHLASTSSKVKSA